MVVLKVHYFLKNQTPKSKKEIFLNYRNNIVNKIIRSLMTAVSFFLKDFLVQGFLTSVYVGTMLVFPRGLRL